MNQEQIKRKYQKKTNNDFLNLERNVRICTSEGKLLGVKKVIYGKALIK